MSLFFFRCTTMLASIFDCRVTKNCRGIKFLVSKCTYCSGEMWCNHRFNYPTFQSSPKSMFSLAASKKWWIWAQISQESATACHSNMGLTNGPVPRPQRCSRRERRLLKRNISVSKTHEICRLALFKVHILRNFTLKVHISGHMVILHKTCIVAADIRRGMSPI